MPVPIIPISATPGARLVPKAGADGKLAAGWIPDLSSVYQPLNATLTALNGKSVTGSGDIVLATSPAIITPTIASFANATHSHQNAAGGGSLDAAALGSGVLANARVNWAAPSAIGTTTPPAASLANLTLTGGGYLRPSADGTGALLITKADGTTVIGRIDTTNSRFMIGGSGAPLRALQVNSDGILIGSAESGVDYMRLLASNASGDPEITLFNTGAVDARFTSGNLTRTTGAGMRVNVTFESTGGLIANSGIMSTPASAALGAVGSLILRSANATAPYIRMTEVGAAVRGAFGFAASSSSMIFELGGSETGLGSGTTVLTLATASVLVSTALDVNSNTFRLRTARTPASATASGNQGEIAWDSSYFYVCTAANTWRRVAHATW